MKTTRFSPLFSSIAFLSALMYMPDTGANATTGSGVDLGISEDGTPAEGAPANVLPMTPAAEAQPIGYVHPRERFPVARTEKVLLKSIKFDEALQSRVKIDTATVEEYAEFIKERVKRGEDPGFPAVDIFETPDGKTRYMAGGFHRGDAHHVAKVKEILANVRIGTKEDALLFAATENATHGLKRTQKDKQKALKIVLNHPDSKPWSNVEVAKAAGVSEAMVRDHRTVAQSSSVRVVKKGDKTVKMDVSRIGGKGGKAVKPSTKKGTSKAPAAPGEKGTAGDGSLPATNAKGKPQLAFNEEGEKAFKKIITALGEGGAGFETAVREGTLELTQKDIVAFSMSSPERIRRIYPLVVKGMKPKAAFDFIDQEVTEKTTVDALCNLATAGKISLTLPDLNKLKSADAKGLYEKRGGFHIIIIADGKK